MLSPTPAAATTPMTVSSKSFLINWTSRSRDDVAFHPAHDHTRIGEVADGGLDGVVVTGQLEYHPARGGFHVGAPDVGHDVEALDYFVDDGPRHQLRRKRQVQPLIHCATSNAVFR